MVIIAGVMIDGVTQPLTAGATYYHATSVRPSWARRFENTVTIGVHKFYKPVKKFTKK
jgi:spore germination cell wall hydrolase CwlJ-like protein